MERVRQPPAESVTTPQCSEAALTCHRSAADCNSLGNICPQRSESKDKPPLFAEPAQVCAGRGMIGKNSEWLFLRRNSKCFRSLPLTVIEVLHCHSSPSTDRTLPSKGTQELAWFNIAARVETLLRSKTIVRDSITASVR